MSLLKAATALDDLAAERTPERATLIAGALALGTLIQGGGADHELLDAAASPKSRQRTGHTCALTSPAIARTNPRLLANCAGGEQARIGPSDVSR
jgi:hypothetical protein